MITGESRNALDDKGRIMIPSRLRTEIAGNTLVVTKGFDTCLLLFTPEEWKRISENLMQNTSLLDPKARLVRRFFIGPAQEVELDKSGRINIPPALREAAELEKECIIIGIGKYLEIWAESAYKEYQEVNLEDLEEAAKEFSKLLSI